MTVNNISAHVPAPTAWDDTIALFEQDLHRRGRPEATIRTYTSALRVFGRFYREELGKTGPIPAKLQETDCQAFIDHLRRERLLAPSSLNRFITSLRSLSRFLLEQRWHRRDITKDLKTYFIGNTTPPVSLTAREIRQLITAIDLNGRNGLRDLAILQILLQCGLRVGEASRLRVEDVNIQPTAGHLRVRDEKTRAERCIPLNASARSAVQAYLQSRGGVAGAEPLFLSERRRPISAKRLQHLAKKLLCLAGRPDLSAHDLRHHFATVLYHRLNGKLAILQKVLGHRQVTTTARYVRVGEEEIRTALEGLPDNVYPEDGRAGREP